MERHTAVILDADLDLRGAMRGGEQGGVRGVNRQHDVRGRVVGGTRRNAKEVFVGFGHGGRGCRIHLALCSGMNAVVADMTMAPVSHVEESFSLGKP